MHCDNLVADHISGRILVVLIEPSRPEKLQAVSKSSTLHGLKGWGFGSSLSFLSGEQPNLEHGHRLQQPSI